MADSEAPRIVLGPDVLAGSFFEPDCRAVLELWRDGVVRPVVTRGLLAAYLSVLRSMGVSGGLLRRWALWFTAKDTVEVYMDGDAPASSVAACLAQAAALGACPIIVNRPVWRDFLPPHADAYTVDGFLARHKRP